MSPSLEDYSTFQYMLARPRIASEVTSKCTSFVFYDGPREKDNQSIICRGDINTFNYYICCLMVLPSHMLGTSQWISAEDVSSKACRPGDELRRFRYSYYGGFLSVETVHLCVDGSGSGGGEKFRLVEYMDCPISVWVLSHAIFVFGSTMVAFGLQYSGFYGISLSSAIGIVFVVFHGVLACTGVDVFGVA